MSELKITQLGQSGAHEAEVEALTKISECLPPQWLAYSNLELRDASFGNREIDLVLVTYDRIIIVELKRWNGELRNENGRWLLNKQDRGKSPVGITDQKCKILKQQLLNKEQHVVGSNVLVSPIVVLCGRATPDGLTIEERGFTVSLIDFLRIGEKSSYSRVFKQLAKRSDPLYKQKEVFNRFFSIKNFDARIQRYYSYVPEENPIFSHASDLYEEFIAVYEQSIRSRALLRVWQLTNLPPQFSTQAQWIEVVERERKVIAFAKDVLPTRAASSTLLTQIGSMQRDELSSNYFELYELPRNLETLDEFVHGHESDLSLKDRLELALSLMNSCAEFHDERIAHQDLSAACIWTSYDFSVAISRWVAASFPEGESVGAVRLELHSGRTMTPEDKFGMDSDPYRKDVYLLGALVFFILTGEKLPIESRLAEFKGLPEGFAADEIDRDKLTDFFGRALDWDPANRYKTADEMHVVLQAVAPRTDYSADVFHDELTSYQSNTIPYVTYPLGHQRSNNTERMVYESTHEGRGVYVKIWHTLRASTQDSANNHRILRFLQAAEALNRVKSSCTQKIVEYGISDVGLFLVCEHIDGQDLKAVLASDSVEIESRIGLAQSCIACVDQMHAMSISHGDIKAENLLIVEAEDPAQAPAIVAVDVPDIDAAGAVKHTPALRDTRGVGPDEYDQDRYGALLVLCELLAGKLTFDGATPHVEFECVKLEIVEEEINRLFDKHEPIGTLSTVNARLSQALKDYKSSSIAKIIVPFKRADQRLPLYPDHDKYVIKVDGLTKKTAEKRQLDSESDRHYEIAFIGDSSVLHLVFDNREKRIIFGRLLSEKSEWGSDKAKKDDTATLIIFTPSHENDFSNLEAHFNPVFKALITSYQDSIAQAAEAESASEELALAHEYISTESLEGGEPGDEEHRAVVADTSTASTGGDLPPLADIWRAFINAEENVRPEVRATEDAEQVKQSGSRDIHIFQFESVNQQPIEFDAGEQVLVELKDYRGSDYRQIGKLAPNYTTSSVLGVETSYGIRAGSQIRLESKLTKASYDKRRIAIDRLIERKAVQPHLIDWFSGARADAIDPVVDKDHLEASSETSATSDITELNEGQCNALATVLNHGPIGLVQGPPGTGKTQFIASLIRKILSDGPADILLISQSHEAVNNCIDKLVATYADDLDALDLVRVGPLEMCSGLSAKFHVGNLRDRYKHKFDRERRDRLEAAAKGIGLPSQFKSQYIRLALSTRPLVARALQLERQKNDESVDEQSWRKAVAAIEASFKSRVGKISKPLLDYYRPDDLGRSVREMSAFLAERHEVHNPSAIHRLHALVALAFDWSDALASPHGNFDEFLTRTKKIVAGTCIGIGRRELNITSQQFDWTIIDEAARCSSGELAVPSQMAKRLVLVGDHQQLPPMYTKELVEDVSDQLTIPKQRLMGYSDFYQVFNSEYGQQYGHALLEQYRMAPAIAKMVSDLFYQGQLITKKKTFVLNDMSMPELLATPVTWLNPVGERTDDAELVNEDTHSYENPIEARAIVDIVRQIDADDALRQTLIATSEDGSKPVGVICLYAGQKRLIERELMKGNISSEVVRLFKIDTVDSYQGKENLIVILSLVRDNLKRQVGFLRAYQRINVAISRAMERLVVVGSERMWSDSSAPPGQIFKYIHARSEDSSSYRVIRREVA